MTAAFALLALLCGYLWGIDRTERDTSHALDELEDHIDYLESEIEACRFLSISPDSVPRCGDAA